MPSLSLLPRATLTTTNTNTNMTTAQYRNEAYEAYTAGQYLKAAMLYRMAIGAYPSAYIIGSLAAYDIDKMSDLVKRCEKLSAA